MRLDPDSETWVSLLISWIRAEVGEDEFRKLDIRPTKTESGKSAVRFSDVVEPIFRRLGTQHQLALLTAMRRPEVIPCLAAINALVENAVLLAGHEHSACPKGPIDELLECDHIF